MVQVLLIDGPMRGEFREIDGRILAFAEPAADALTEPCMKIGYYHVHQCVLFGQPQYIGSMIAQVTGNELELEDRVRETLSHMVVTDIMQLYGQPGCTRPSRAWTQVQAHESVNIGGPGTTYTTDRQPTAGALAKVRHYCGRQGCWYARQGFSRCEPGECILAGREYRGR